MARTYFFWDPLSDNILQERDETGAVTAEYTAEPGLYGNIISQNRGGVESQFHYDAQGSTLAVTNDDQNVTDTFAYTAFGEVTERTGTTEVPFQFIGQKGYYTDGLTGEYLVRRRPYEPTRARWLAIDPIRQKHGAYTSPYVYSSNSPCRLIDSSGLTPDCDLARPLICETIDAQNVLSLDDDPEAKCRAFFCATHGFPDYTCVEQPAHLWCVKCACIPSLAAAVDDSCCGTRRRGVCKAVANVLPLIGVPTCRCEDDVVV
jgi:RHS repeat-associated protein